MLRRVVEVKCDTIGLKSSSIGFTPKCGIIEAAKLPAFGEEGKEDLDSWKLVHFIRHLPNITPEEIETMKSMNPKTPDELKEEETIRRFLEGDDSQPPSIPGHKHD